jgi:hypothetical protein
VIGIPDPVLGQEIKAFVVTSAPVAEDELRAFAAARLAKFQVPRLWEFRDSLPKTPTAAGGEGIGASCSTIGPAASLLRAEPTLASGRSVA